MNETPLCVGIIMDGNRRWARARNIPLIKGHEAGVETLKNTVRAAKELGVGTLIFYTFSTENWNRAKEEVEALMLLFRRAIKKEGTYIHCYPNLENRYLPTSETRPCYIRP